MPVNTFCARPLLAVLVAAVAGWAATAPAIAADAFPTKPVRIVVPSAPGGLADVTARQLALKMAEKLGQNVIVENRPGGDTLIGTRIVKEAPADGYTVLLQGDGITVWPALKKDPGYDLVKDFSALGGIFRMPLLMVVGADQPDQTLTDFIARAKANPGKMSFASGGTGSGPHIGAAIFLRRAGLDLLHVPYKGNATAMPDVASGRVDMIFDVYATSMPLIKAGKMRALAVSSPNRHVSLPDIPTFSERGVANASYTSWLALFVPAATPADVRQRLTEALQSAVASKELSDRFRTDGNEPILMSADEFNQAVKAQLAQAGTLITDLGLPKVD
jgi:tripartite-type tricarboxylate transporter receptor subunit TctC